ncbi:hypothetical protein OAZ06_03110 [Synechococcus sp. AH-736-G20]|nr:hypothetical protein [Synechococcus sp. AH-736-G20]
MQTNRNKHCQLKTHTNTQKQLNLHQSPRTITKNTMENKLTIIDNGCDNRHAMAIAYSNRSSDNIESISLFQSKPKRYWKAADMIELIKVLKQSEDEELTKVVLDPSSFEWAPLLSSHGVRCVTISRSDWKKYKSGEAAATKTPSEAPGKRYMDENDHP